MMIQVKTQSARCWACPTTCHGPYQRSCWHLSSQLHVSLRSLPATPTNHGVTLFEAAFCHPNPRIFWPPSWPACARPCVALGVAEAAHGASMSMIAATSLQIHTEHWGGPRDLCHLYFSSNQVAAWNRPSRLRTKMATGRLLFHGNAPFCCSDLSCYWWLLQCCVEYVLQIICVMARYFLVVRRCFVVRSIRLPCIMCADVVFMWRCDCSAGCLCGCLFLCLSLLFLACLLIINVFVRPLFF